MRIITNVSRTFVRVSQNNTHDTHNIIKYSPVARFVQNTTKHSLANNHLPQIFSGLPGPGIILSGLRVGQSLAASQAGSIDVGQGQDPLWWWSIARGTSDHHCTSIHNLVTIENLQSEIYLVKDFCMKTAVNHVSLNLHVSIVWYLSNIIAKFMPLLVSFWHKKYKYNTCLTTPLK